MSKKNQETAVETPAQVEKIEKVELTEEQKQERIQSLRTAHKLALSTKDTEAAKKVRTKLRKMGIYLSKERNQAIEALATS